MLSVVKYFNRYDNGNNNKFIYDDDYDMLDLFIKENDIKIRTTDVQIVDLADEIAYAAHDLEDGLRVKAYVIDEILHEYHSLYGDSESYKKLCELVNNAKDKSGFGNRKIDSTEYCKLFRQELSSSIIYTLISDIGLIKIDENFKKKTGSINDEELGFSSYGELADGLKEITFKCINHNNDVYYYEQRGLSILKYLCNFYRDHTRFLPPEYRANEMMSKYGFSNKDEKTYQERLICDYISGMMDSYAISIYEDITGKSFKNILGE